MADSSQTKIKTKNSHLFQLRSAPAKYFLATVFYCCRHRLSLSICNCL
ncbi:hypothetical protein [Methanimicrococcus hongohii]|nr:hypothetical protein [Methanimicrococcus sp. Hf6]